ncbi:hypothetical protein [Nocardioides stalactiti]|uniref:hypothetical protein n=1 Tax=Nocardioides stalactiti TaxID=2755356 RepID=UPI0016044DEE|nr:hypothetical protein [Nocardioides stalactiti]
MSRQIPRRPSRTSTPRPRKIAGRDETAVDATVPADAPAADAPAGAPGKPAAPAPPAARKPSLAKPAATSPAATEPAADSDQGSTGRTSTLLAVVGVLVVLLALQCGWFAWNAVRDEAVSAAPAASRDEDGPIAVPSGRPVVLNQVSVQGGVEAAAAAAQVMFARNWKTYDQGVEDAVALMTEDFGEEFRTTTDDVEAEFVRKKTEVQVRVVAQSVVRANETELEALIFLNQYVFRGEGENGTSTYTPYRALMTMVHTDAGWLVDGVDTK